jgi:site-specific recombinase XerD
MRVSDALAAMVVQLEADGRSVHTVKQIERHVRLFASWAGDPLVADVGHEIIARFLASDAVRQCASGGPRKASSANAIRSSVRALGAFLHGAGYTASNPTRLVRRARTRPPTPTALSDADAGKLLAALDGARTVEERRDRALFVTMLRCGLRLGSALGLDVGDIDFDAGEIHLRVLKNGGEDLVVLPDDVARILREHVGERTSGPVFLASHGGRIGARHVRRRLEQWGKRAGVGAVHPHALRHSFAMRVYERTGDVLVTAAALCHRSVASAQVYARPTRERVRAAVG